MTMIGAIIVYLIFGNIMSCSEPSNREKYGENTNTIRYYKCYDISYAVVELQRNAKSITSSTSISFVIVQCTQN